MKKISEKDLSLDNQKVSNLSGATDTREETNELICGSKVCTESHYEICCALTKEEKCVIQSDECQPSVNECPPATGDTLCDDCSQAETCLDPLPETKLC